MAELARLAGHPPATVSQLGDGGLAGASPTDLVYEVGGGDPPAVLRVVVDTELKVLALLDLTPEVETVGPRAELSERRPGAVVGELMADGGASPRHAEVVARVGVARLPDGTGGGRAGGSHHALSGVRQCRHDQSSDNSPADGPEGQPSCDGWSQRTSPFLLVVQITISLYNKNNKL